MFAKLPVANQYSSNTIRSYKQKMSQSMRDQEKIIRRVQLNGLKIDFVAAYIDRYFKTHLTYSPLLALAKKITECSSVKLDRLAKRNRSALLCWYAENWDIAQAKIKCFDASLLPFLDSSDSVVSSPEEVRPIINVSQCSPTANNMVDPSDILQLLNDH